MTDEQIKYMRDRFLGWRLPEHFQPDCGISFSPNYNGPGATPLKHEPVGTNLFDAGQTADGVGWSTSVQPSPAF